jgi:hypothetical protein
MKQRTRWPLFVKKTEIKNIKEMYLEGSPPELAGEPICSGLFGKVLTCKCKGTISRDLVGAVGYVS